MLDLEWQLDMDAATFDNLDQEYRIGPSSDQAKGRLVSLSLFGSPADPRYAAVWENGGRPREQRLIQGDKAFVQNMYFMLRDLLGFTAEIIAATSDASATHFALVMRRRYTDERPGDVTWDLPVGGLLPADPATPTVIQTHRKDNYRLSWAVSYRRPESSAPPPLVAAVWTPQQVPARNPWGLDAVAASRWTPWTVEPNDPPKTYQKKFDAHVAGGARLQLVAPFCAAPVCMEGPSPVVGSAANDWFTNVRYLSIWYGDMIGPWWCRVDLSKDQCEALRYDPPPELEGFSPIRIMATGSAKDPRYAMIFATRTEPLPKYAKVVKPYTPGAIFGPGDGLDDDALSFMARNGIRRGQIASTVGRRLVAARAYTVAEAGYEQGRKTGHRDVFRLASVSKTLTALLVMRRIQDGIFADANTKIGPLMGWGGAWNGVTLRNLLMHVNSLRGDEPSEQEYLDRYNLIAMLEPPAGGNPLQPTTLPITDTTVYEPLLKVADVGTDGLWSYSNPGFELLGRVLVNNAGRLEDQMPPVLGPYTPLRIGRLRPGIVRVADQVAGEAFYHSGIPTVVIDKVSGTGQWVPGPYGGRNVAARLASAGWVCAAIDLARIMAFLEGDSDGILTTGSVKGWLWGRESIAAPRMTTSGSTLRPALGWDVYDNSTTTSLPMVVKNGAGSGYISLLARHIDGRSVAAVFNGNRIESNAGEGALGSGDAWGYLNRMPTVPANFDLFLSPNVDPLWAAP